MYALKRSEAEVDSVGKWEEGKREARRLHRQKRGLYGWRLQRQKEVCMVEMVKRSEKRAGERAGFYFGAVAKGEVDRDRGEESR